MPLDPGARQALLDAVDSLREDTLALTMRLSRHRSVLGHEASCLDDMAEILSESGLEPRRIPTDPAALERLPGFSPPLIPYAGRDNVAALHAPRSATGRSLMLQGHLDVVPEGDASLWTTPPFEPTVRDDRLWGRGCGDMKAGVAAIVGAWRALRLAGLRPAAPLQMGFVVEEECTGNGALALMHALPRPDACLIPEPGPGHEALYVAEVGVIWAWITVTGRPAHVREMRSGVNAIEAAMQVAERFRRLEDELNRAERRHPAFAADNHPINVNVGTLEGGEWNSSVPTRARLGLRIGVMPGHDVHAAAAEIRAVVRELEADPALRGAKLSLEFRGFMADGCTFPPDQPIARAVSRAHQALTGEALRHYAAAGLTDARHYVLHGGTQATCYGPDAENIHGIDESVGLESMHRVARVVALTVAEWCGVERG